MLALAVFIPAGIEAQNQRAPENVPIAVYLDKAFLGNFPASLEEEENPKLIRREISAVLNNSLDEETRRKLFSGITAASDTVSLEELLLAGIEGDYDSNLLELSLFIPPGLRRTEQIRLITSPEIPLDTAEKPSFYSAYINVQTRGEYFIQWFESGESESRIPLSLLLQPVANIDSWVTEGEIFFETYPANEVTLNYARVIKDFPTKSIRLNAGSLMFPLEGMFPASSPQTGIGILRDPTLTYQRRAPLTSRQEIFLMNPAAVTIIINGLPIRTFRLPPGRHVLGNFPFTSGLNNVKIEIREEGLPPRTEEFSVPFDASLLVPGDYTYYAALGVPQWESDPPTATAFFRMGVLEDLTLGAHLKAGMDRGIAGFEAIWASPAGSIRTDGGVSGGPQISPDFGAGIQYRFTLAGKKTLPVAGFGIRYDGGNYLPPESGRKTNLHSWQYSLGLSQNLPGGIGSNIGFGYRTGRGETADNVTGSLGLSRSFGNGFSLSFNLNVSTLPGGGLDWRGGIFLSSNPPGDRKSFNMSHNIVDGSASIDYQVRPRTPEGSPGYYATFTGLPYGDNGGGQVRGSVTYAHEYFEGALANSVYRGSDGVPAWSNGFSWNGSSAAVISDGVWRISRPIRDGFVLVVPGESLEGKTVRIYSGNDADIKTATPAKPGILSDLRAYAPLRLELDIPGLPLDQEAERPERLLTPTYKTGYLLRVDTSPRIYGSGRLLFLDGRPIALQGGEIFSPAERDFEVQPVFTDEDGVFQFHNLKPGTYRIRLYIHTMAREELIIPENASGFFSLGEITLPVLIKE
jgi:outer membrane usher protein